MSKLSELLGKWLTVRGFKHEPMGSAFWIGDNHELYLWTRGQKVYTDDSWIKMGTDGFEKRDGQKSFDLSNPDSFNKLKEHIESTLGRAD